jgi:hypothetical protein
VPIEHVWLACNSVAWLTFTVPFPALLCGQPTWCARFLGARSPDPADCPGRHAQTIQVYIHCSLRHSGSAAVLKAAATLNSSKLAVAATLPWHGLRAAVRVCWPLWWLCGMEAGQPPQMQHGVRSQGQPLGAMMHPGCLCNRGPAATQAAASTDVVCATIAPVVTSCNSVGRRS